jgi:hypothetical protein
MTNKPRYPTPEEFQSLISEIANLPPVTRDEIQQVFSNIGQKIEVALAASDPVVNPREREVLMDVNYELAHLNHHLKLLGVEEARRVHWSELFGPPAYGPKE